jgi:hypothetical protein
MIFQILTPYLIYKFFSFFLLKIKKFNEITIFASIYILILICIFFYVILWKINLNELWIIFNFYNFFVAMDIWLFGLLKKSVSINILRFLSEKNCQTTLKKLTNECVYKLFYQRVLILKKNKFLTINKLIKITELGEKKKLFILKIRKIFKIKNAGYYKLN